MTCPLDYHGKESHRAYGTKVVPMFCERCAKPIDYDEKELNLSPEEHAIAVLKYITAQPPHLVDPSVVKIAQGALNARRTPDLKGYNVYKDGRLIGSTDDKAEVDKIMGSDRFYCAVRGKDGSFHPDFYEETP